MSSTGQPNPIPGGKKKALVTVRWVVTQEDLFAVMAFTCKEYVFLGDSSLTMRLPNGNVAFVKGIVLEQLGWPTSFEFSSIAGGDLIEVTAAIRGMKYRGQRLLCSLWGNYASTAGEDCPYTKAMVYELLLAAKVKSVSVV